MKIITVQIYDLRDLNFKGVMAWIWNNYHNRMHLCDNFGLVPKILIQSLDELELLM